MARAVPVPDSLEVTADFAIGDVPAGENLAKRLNETSPGVWEWTLPKPITALPRGTLTVQVRDQQGNVSRVERTIWVR